MGTLVDLLFIFLAFHHLALIVRPLQLYLAEQRRRGEEARFETWPGLETFRGKEFGTEEEANQVFDDARGQVIDLIRHGKIVRVV